MRKDDGVEILLQFLDSVFKEDDLVETYSKYQDFEKFVHKSDVSIED